MIKNNGFSKLVLNKMRETVMLGEKTTDYNIIEYTTDLYCLTIKKHDSMISCSILSFRTLDTVTYRFADLADFKNNLNDREDK